MKLIVSFNPLYHDWYVGEFYSSFFNFLKNANVAIDFEYISSPELAAKYGVDTPYHNGVPSVFNPTNLIIFNPENNKTFIHSWHDYAPAILSEGSGINNFDVAKFACVSRLTSSEYSSIKQRGINIQPSFYLLENWSELKLVEHYFSKPKPIDKIYFNGLGYGMRQRYVNLLNKSNFFSMKLKDQGGYLPKDKYYEEFAQHKYGFSIDGAAKICYRDLECFGMGILLFREELDVVFSDPIVEGTHYIKLIDEDIKSKINNNEHDNYILDKINLKIENILSSKDVPTILAESRSWYEKNCFPENQLKIMYSFLDNFNIFE
jgi:hypothetical protein